MVSACLIYEWLLAGIKGVCSTFIAGEAEDP